MLHVSVCCSEDDDEEEDDEDEGAMMGGTGEVRIYRAEGVRISRAGE